MGLQWKSRKSRDTWCNRQVWPWSAKWSRAKANKVLSREHTGHSKHPFLTTQEMTLHMDITKWLIPKSDWFYSLQPKMEKLYTASKNKTRSWLWLRSRTPYWQIQTYPFHTSFLILLTVPHGEAFESDVLTLFTFPFTTFVSELHQTFTAKTDVQEHSNASFLGAKWFH